MERMEGVLALLVDHPVARVHVQAIVSEMDVCIKGLEASGASAEVIANQVNLFEERIEAVIDNAVGADSHDGEEDGDEEIIGRPSDEFEPPHELSEEEDAAQQAADARVKARIQLAVETSQKEIESIRARGEDDRWIAEEERRLEETIDTIIRDHTDTLHAAKDSSPFRSLPLEQRAEAEGDVAWVEAQFARLHVEENSKTGLHLENATVKHAFYSSELEGLLQMLAPEFDQDLKEALKLQQKEKRLKEKSDAAILKHTGKQERKNTRQEEHDARRKAEHDARYKERQLERLQQRLLTLQDGTPMHHEITRIEDELRLSSELSANKAREVAAQAKQRMLARRGDFKS